VIYRSIDPGTVKHAIARTETLSLSSILSRRSNRFRESFTPRIVPPDFRFNFFREICERALLSLASSSLPPLAASRKMNVTNVSRLAQPSLPRTSRRNRCITLGCIPFYTSLIRGLRKAFTRALVRASRHTLSKYLYDHLTSADRIADNLFLVGTYADLPTALHLLFFRKDIRRLHQPKTTDARCGSHTIRHDCDYGPLLLLARNGKSADVANFLPTTRVPA